MTNFSITSEIFNVKKKYVQLWFPASSYSKHFCGKIYQMSKLKPQFINYYQQFPLQNWIDVNQKHLNHLQINLLLE